MYYYKKERMVMMKKEAPKINTRLRSHTIIVPECIRNASGIVINGKRIKSLLFSTDVAVISNCNADAVIAVYPFTPTMQITNAIIDVSQRPVFAGVGGGTTAGPRVREIALDAELHGATAVVLNAPTKTEFIQELSDYVDIPVVLSIVSGGKNTVAIVKELRKISPHFPIIATGGPTIETIQKVIEAGANAVTYTPPSNGDIFKLMMEEYRQRCHKP